MTNFAIMFSFFSIFSIIIFLLTISTFYFFGARVAKIEKKFSTAFFDVFVAGICAELIATFFEIDNFKFLFFLIIFFLILKKQKLDKKQYFQIFAALILGILAAAGIIFLTQKILLQIF